MTKSRRTMKRITLDSAGLGGAQALGDKAVESLKRFSWGEAGSKVRPAEAHYKTGTAPNFWTALPDPHTEIELKAADGRRYLVRLQEDGSLYIHTGTTPFAIEYMACDQDYTRSEFGIRIIRVP